MSLFRRKKDPVRSPKGTDDQGYVFRRSRTLTGTTSSRVNPSAESRGQLKTTRLQAHELHQMRKRIMRILGVVVVVIAIISYLLSTYVADIKLQFTQPEGHPQTATYQKTVQDYFSKHPLERFGFAINTKQFANDMQAEHRELLSVDVDRNWYGGGTVFVLQFRRPILVWETAGHRFYVDGQGVAFEYDHFQGKYVAVSDKSGISPGDAGGTVASNRFINFLGKMVGAVNAGDKGQVTDIIIPASTREADLKLEGRGYVFKTHTDRDPLQQAQDIINTIRWLDDRKLKPEYVDVRVAGKAYFK